MSRRPAPPLAGELWTSRWSDGGGRVIRVTEVSGWLARYEVVVTEDGHPGTATGGLSVETVRGYYRRLTVAESIALQGSRKSVSMTRSPQERLDLTGADSFRYVEVKTDAGLVRVCAGVTGRLTGLPSVVVEVERNIESAGIRLTSGGGDWDLEVHELARRTDVVLTRQPESGPACAPAEDFVIPEERIIARRLRALGVIPPGVTVTDWTYCGPDSQWAWNLRLSDGRGVASRHDLASFAEATGIQVSGKAPLSRRGPSGQWTVVEPWSA